MRLSEYLTATRTTPTAFARKLGVAHSTVMRWAAGEVAPTLDWMERIATETGGDVMPNDFLRRTDPATAIPADETHNPAIEDRQ